MVNNADCFSKIVIRFSAVDGASICISGKLVHPSGAIYEGDFSNNMMHGQGKYIFPDASVYEGPFLENRWAIHLTNVNQLWPLSTPISIDPLNPVYIRLNILVVVFRLQQIFIYRVSSDNLECICNTMCDSQNSTIAQSVFSMSYYKQAIFFKTCTIMLRWSATFE